MANPNQEQAAAPAAAGVAPAAAAPVKKKKRTVQTENGIVFIKSTFNNTIVTIADETGAVLAWKSGGTIGFKGSRKSTPFAAQMAAEACAEKAKEFGIRKVRVMIKGPGAGRETAIRTLQTAGLDVVSIKDVTPVPHNGCRPKKRRRI